ncbi:MAG: DUF1295 domain-containing protein [Myxococcales bacterium]|nr:DUF1295 domain-containing protein [Myxococcales bacterium]
MSPFDMLALAWLAIGALVLPAALFKTAPYGRHTVKSAGPTIPARVGWTVMESPSALLPLLLFALYPRFEPVPLVLLALFELHYIHRAFIYPFSIRAGARPMPVSIAAGAFFFTSVNGLLQGWVITHQPFAMDPRVVLGTVLFFAGFAVNKHSDRILFALRAPGESGYRIPRGGLYGLVSCPNYLGEIVQWCGFALASYSIAGLSFAVWTIANLLPRARAHHLWYRETFPDYPRERKALLPWLY